MVDQCGRVILAAAGSFALVLVLRLVLVDLDLSAAARLPMLVLTFVLLYGTIVLAAGRACVTKHAGFVGERRAGRRGSGRPRRRASRLPARCG